MTIHSLICFSVNVVNESKKISYEWSSQISLTTNFELCSLLFIFEGNLTVGNSFATKVSEILDNTLLLFRLK